MNIDEIIYYTAVADGMPDDLALYMTAQARHETGNYKHRFFTIGKNAFGYSYFPASHWQIDKGGPDADNGVPIAQYETIQNSVHEVTDWIKRRQRDGIFPANLRTITTPQLYATLLKEANYYTDTISNYANGLISALRSIGTSIVSPSGATILALTVILIFAFKNKLFGK